MFSKIAKKLKLSSRSLSSKLTVLYTLSTLGLFVGMCLFLYPTFSQLLGGVKEDHMAYIAGICYKKITMALIITSFCSILLGKVVVQNGLRRIHEFSAKLEKISADSLHERIDPNDWPTELKTLGRKFNFMLDRLQTSFVQLTQFSSDIAHELRNPLHNLRGITEISLAREQLPEEFRTILESYMDEYQHLSKLIENLLFLARSDHGQIAIDKKLINTRDEIYKICDYYHGVMDEKQIKISYEGEATVYADPTLFKRIINNLVSNAIRYVPADGKISIQMTQLNDDLAQISVHDTGIGIEETHLPKVFDRFYRVDASRCANSGGLGLGLAIVKSIIELHQGKIRIESKVSAGTSVFMQLPSAVYS